MMELYGYIATIKPEAVVQGSLSFSLYLYKPQYDFQVLLSSDAIEPFFLQVTPLPGKEETTLPISMEKFDIKRHCIKVGDSRSNDFLCHTSGLIKKCSLSSVIASFILHTVRFVKGKKVKSCAQTNETCLCHNKEEEN